MTLTLLRSMLLASTVMCTVAAGNVFASQNNNQNNSNNTTINNQGGAGGAGGTGIGYGGTGIGYGGTGVGLGGSAVSNSASTSLSNAVARQNQRQGQGQGQVQGIANSGNATINNNVPANTFNETKFSGSYTVHNTPNVYAPALAGGANPCVVGVSAGGAVAGFGISFGLTRNDDGCERRNTAALLHNMGERDVAQEVLCETESVRQARLRVGRPCVADRATTTTAQAGTAQSGTAIHTVAVQQNALNMATAAQSNHGVASSTNNSRSSRFVFNGNFNETNN